MQAFARGVVYANTVIRGSCGVYETLHLLATLLTDLLIDGAIERNFCSPQSAPSAFKIKDGNWRQAKILTARSPDHIELHHSDHTVPISRHIVILFQMASINVLYDKLVEVHCLEFYFFILLTLYLSHVGLNGIELSEADDTTTYLISSPGVKFGLSDCCLILFRLEYHTSTVDRVKHPLLAIRTTLELVWRTFESHQNKLTHQTCQWYRQPSQ